MLGGRYQIEAPIGEGGMARVFRAHDARLDRTVAIKVLREQFTHEQEFVDRFRQEARLAAGLSHPAIVGVYDVGVDHGRHYMVMEYVEGENLRTVIARQAPMPLEAVIPLMRQLVAALDYAHDHGVIHRDIKPENILITGRGEVKVGDFGIARALASAGLTATGTVLGSVSYFSPEQASGQAATAESDLYSAGIILYEMLTRQVPFAGPNPVAVAMAQVNDPPPSPRTFRPDLPPAVEAVVLRALAKDPHARFHSGYELITALAAPAPQQAGRRPAAAAMAATLPNAPVAPVSALPHRPRRQGTGGALAALLTTAALLVAAVLVGRTLTSGNSAAGTATATSTPAAPGITPQAGSSAVVPGLATATAPRQVATATATVPGATTGQAPVPSATAGTAAPPTPPPSTATAAPPATATSAPPTDTPPAAPTATAAPSDTPAPGQPGPGNATIELVTALHVGAHFAPVGVTTTFSARTPAIFAVAQVHHKPKGASVLFVWHYPDGSTFPFDNTYVNAYGGDVTAYAELIPRGPGDYSVTTSIRGHQLASVAFTVTSAPGPSATGAGAADSSSAGVGTGDANNGDAGTPPGQAKGHKHHQQKND